MPPERSKSSGCLPALLLLPLRVGRHLVSPVAPSAPVRLALGRGVALRGRVWTGGAAEPYPDGVVVVGPDGVVEAVGPADRVSLPAGLRVLTGGWVGPGIVDAHVHLAFAASRTARSEPLAPDPGGGGRGRRTAEQGKSAVAGRGGSRGGRKAAVAGRGGGGRRTAARRAVGAGDDCGGAVDAPEVELRGAVVAVRDLGAPPGWVRGWRAADAPVVAAAGPLVTAPGGYPVRSWGARGFGAEVGDPVAARRLVAHLAADGVDLVKVAVEDAAGAPPLQPEVLQAVVDAAHAAGLPVTAHALSDRAVRTVLDAGVDELAHVPTGVLGADLVGRIAAAGIPVVSTLQCHAGEGRTLANAAALHRAGVPLLYGTDLGNGGTRPGADPRELDRLAGAGLGRWGALRAATEGAAGAAGLAGRAPAGRIAVGEPAALVLLPADPLVEPAAWRSPLAVLAGGRLHTADLDPAA